jgi:hypothetical protein
MRHLLLSASLLLTFAGSATAMAQDAPASAQAAPAESAVPAESAAPAAQPEQATPAAQAAPSQKAAGDSVAPPPTGKGQVVFFRPSKFSGAALSFSVHEGDKGVGKLGNGSYFIDVSDPGAHTFTIQSEAKDSLTLEVEAGETYYVKQTIGMGIVMGRPHLSPVTKEEFDASKLKLSTKKPSDLKAGS